jgi:cytochrome P450
MVRKEVDTVLEGKPIQPEHLGKLPYIVAVMREGLRLHPPAPAITVTPFEDEVIGGKYLVRKGNMATVQIAFLHRDPLVYGEDAESFKPERMLDGKFEALPVSNALVNMHRADRNSAKSMVALWKRRSSMYCKQPLGCDRHSYLNT